MLRENLLNLAARVLNGEYEGKGGEEQLRSQLIRVYRGASFERVPGKVVVLAGGGSSTVPGLVAEVEASGVSASFTVSSGACPMRRRHGVFQRRGEACPTCGRRKGA